MLLPIDLQFHAGSGPVTTYDIDRDRREIDVTKRIAEERPDESPFIVILMRARKRPTTNTELQWWDDQPWAWWDNVNTAAGASETTIHVDNPAIFAPKDVIFCPRTEEQMYVNEVDVDGGTITVSRGYGITPAADLQLGDKLMLLANAMEQNSLAPASKIGQPRKRFNYTQTVRTPFDESMQSATDNLRTNESERKRLRRKKLLDHRLALERTAIWGQRMEDPVNKRHLTNGIAQYITSNIFDFNGEMDEKTFFTEFSRVAFQYGSKNKLLLTSPYVASRINEFAREKIQTESGQRTYGLQLNYIQTFHGRLYIVTSEFFENDLASQGFVLDMTNIHYRPKQGRDTRLRPNIQENDRDGWKDEYLTEFAMQVELDRTHVRFVNAVS